MIHRKWLRTVIIAVLFGAVSTAGCGAAGDDIIGIFMLIDGDFNIDGPWDDCRGTGGYDDLDAGTFVRLENEMGDRIGASVLRSITEADLDTLVAANLATDFLDASAPEEEIRSAPEDYEGAACLWMFEFADVPEAEVYVLEVGSRGEGTYTRAQLVEEDFFIAIGIGP